MKKGIVFLFLVVVQGWAFGQEIQWMTLEEALEAQKKNLEKLLWMYTPSGVGRAN